MCTAINLTDTAHIFGRTLDLERSYGECVAIAPRDFKFNFLHLPPIASHSALFGIAHVAEGVPLYYDAANEDGLCAAALNFKGRAHYIKPKSAARCLASFEVIPWMLTHARSVEEARRFLSGITLTDESFSGALSATPLHWIFADKSGSVVAEQTEEGMKIHDNPIGVLSNSPDFRAQTENLEHYAHIFYATKRIKGLHCRGLDGFGIPGDFSSPSRFVRAAYVKMRAVGGGAVSRFFHISDSISQVRGATVSDLGEPVKTLYTSAIDTARRRIFFTTYENRRIRCVSLTEKLANGERLSVFPIHSGEDILYLN